MLKLREWNKVYWLLQEKTYGGMTNMKTITVTIEVYDNSSVEDIERAVSAGLDSNGIDCTYDVEEVTE